MRALLAFVILIPLTLVGCHFVPAVMQTDQVRYRITISVGTPKGVRTSSGVWGYSEAPIPRIPFEGGPVWYFSGRTEAEAIPVDIGDGRLVYAVIGKRVMPQDNGAGMHPAGFRPGFSPLFILEMARGPMRSNTTIGSSAYANAHIAWMTSQTGQPVRLDCTPMLHRNDVSDCPALVTLSDLTARTVTLLDPDDLSADLGKGYYLIGMTLEVVNAPITHGITTTLPWAKPGSTTDSNGFAPLADRIKSLGFNRAEPAIE
ncbi:hypothetical protein FPZ24_11945 [Sphingomonas panacisoli]|uniref:Lipoprotein n=1 Tax=Sphingomonas panacisoli TaxID=1813879 RepID=A0A5B8LKJ9_9SPHN|nr:hypothetical protein [Sphingomonas panacisoli]QDZ08104.1 hypothetical protein FPZ24_11945 [Sphingomonas panacisoli]